MDTVNTGIAWNCRSWKQFEWTISVDSDCGPVWRLSWAKLSTHVPYFYAELGAWFVKHSETSVAI